MNAQTQFSETGGSKETLAADDPLKTVYFSSIVDIITPGCCLLTFGNLDNEQSSGAESEAAVITHVITHVGVFAPLLFLIYDYW